MAQAYIIQVHFRIRQLIGHHLLLLSKHTWFGTQVLVYFGCFHIPSEMNTGVSLVPQPGFGHKERKYRQAWRIASTGIQQLGTI